MTKATSGSYYSLQHCFKDEVLGTLLPSYVNIDEDKFDKH